MKKTIAFRMSGHSFRWMESRFRAENCDEEQFAFMLSSSAKGPEETLYLCEQVLYPGPNDLDKQGPWGVRPTKGFQAAAYGLAQDKGTSLFDVHTHTTDGSVHFSGIDDAESLRNAAYFQKEFPPECTMGLLVFNQTMDRFHGRVWDRESKRFLEISQIEALGRFIHLIERWPQPISAPDAMFARHLLIPGWDQTKLEKMKVFIVGLGGNGSWILQALVKMGVGRNGGWIKGCEPDRVEESNLSRIPYAGYGDIGRPKAAVAARYVRSKSPRTKVRFFARPFDNPRCQQEAKEAQFLIGAVDRDTVRMQMNRFAQQYLIPLIDSSAGIIPGDDGCEAGTQVRVIVPGETACMVCGGMLNLSEGDVESLSPEQKEVRRQIGYVRGLDDTPTPSVLHLNGMAAMLAASHFQRMAFGEDTKGKEFVYYDRQQCQIITAALPPPNNDCPVCGTYGVLGRGDMLLDESRPGPRNKPMLCIAGGEESVTVEGPVEYVERPEVEILGGARP